MSKLIIFDLDGVLFESRDMHFEALNQALTICGYDPITYEDHLAHYDGLPTQVKLDKLHIVGEDAEHVKREKQAYTLGWIMKNVKRDEVLVELFTALREKDWRIGIASNAIAMTVVRTIQLLGLWSLVDGITHTGNVANPKPAPDMYLALMEQNEADPQSTWIVEDSPHGREGARAAGAHIIAVSGPLEVPEAVRKVMEAA